MPTTQVTDQALDFRVNGQPRKAQVRTPARLCSHPALLIALAAECGAVFTDGAPYAITPAIFLAAGHRVAGFDLPHHGERADAHGAGLPGMAAAIMAGVDVFGDVRDTARVLIDLCLERGLAGPGGIVVEGTSRGGLAALHVLAGDTRVTAGAAHSAVTDLASVREFAHLAGHPIIAKSNAAALIERLADRPLFLAMGESDPRVDAGRCFEFHARLAARAVTNGPELYTAPGVSHGETYPYETGYQTAAAFLLRHVAARARLLPFPRP